MPAYNAAEHIAEAISSIVAQTYENWELVVVDDGSSDATADVVAGLGLDTERLRLVRAEHRGTGAARNLAIENARGSLLAFLDSDDFWHGDKLTLQVAALLRGNYDVVFSKWYVVYDEPWQPSDLLQGEFSAAEMFTLLYAWNVLTVPAVLATREAVRRAGMFRDRGPASVLSEDYDLWLRLADSGCSFYGLAEPLAGIRARAGSHVDRLLELRECDLEVLSAFDEKMLRVDPQLRRHRLSHLNNTLAMLRAGCGERAAAARSLDALREFESRWRVASKKLLLALLGRRYADFYRFILERGS